MILSKLQAHPGSFQSNTKEENKNRIDPLQKKWENNRWRNTGDCDPLFCSYVFLFFFLQ